MSFATLAIHSLEDVQRECGSLYDECVRRQGRFQQSERTRSPILRCEQLPSSCRATVGMVEECFRENHSRLAQVRTFPPCHRLTEADVNRSIEALLQSVWMPACAKAAVDCRGDVGAQLP